MAMKNTPSSEFEYDKVDYFKAILFLKILILEENNH